MHFYWSRQSGEALRRPGIVIGMQQSFILRGELYTHFVNRMLQDCRMDQEERRLLQELLYAPASGGEQTVKEALARDRNTYGRLAYQIGLLYWYFYENSGGKTAASNWFQEAVQSAQEMGEVPDWLQAARIYQRISGYYERIGKENPLGEEQLIMERCFGICLHYGRKYSFKVQMQGFVCRRRRSCWPV